MLIVGYFFLPDFTWFYLTKHLLAPALSLEVYSPLFSDGSNDFSYDVDDIEDK